MISLLMIILKWSFVTQFDTSNNHCCGLSEIQCIFYCSVDDLKQDICIQNILKYTHADREKTALIINVLYIHVNEFVEFK